MFTHRHTRLLVTLLGLSLLLAACSTDTTTGSNPSPTAGQTPGATVTPTATSQPTVITQPVPATRTDCPASGTARALVTAPFALGTHQNIVYVSTEEDNYVFKDTLLQRYDVTSGSTTQIAKFQYSISNVQMSADGAWLLFVAYPSDQLQTLQAIRMDGQGLQTLYCAQTTINLDIQWSSDQKSIIFSAAKGIFLLNTTSGAVSIVLQPTNSGPPLNSDTVPTPFTWLDNTRLYMTSPSNRPIGPIDSLGWFDTSAGTNQPGTAAKTVYTDKETGNYPCWNADSSYDSTTLFVVQCHGTVASNVSGQGALGGRSGPSKLFAEPATGGALQTIFSSDAFGIKSVRAISKDTLLLLVENYQEHQTVDTSQNGLWKINTDGTGLTCLTTSGPDHQVGLNIWAQTPWANVSRRGNMYALQVDNVTNGTNVTASTLVYGSLSGGATTTIVSSTSGSNDASVVGWTAL